MIRIMVAAHKAYWMPEDEIYLPVFVGAAGKEGMAGYIRDDQGENISEKNGTFCELTGLYWMWKHIDADVYGLCHYRRYLGNRRFWGKKQNRILKENEILNLLEKTDMILPKKRHYWIETRESQYVHAHHAEDLQCTENVLAEKHPDALPAWKHMLRTRAGHICNMFIMPREYFEDYCEWLFDILFELEKRIDLTGYSKNDRRVFGFLAERLMDVWVETRGLNYAEVPMITLEKQNWIRKGYSFLKRKFVR